MSSRARAPRDRAIEVRVRRFTAGLFCVALLNPPLIGSATLAADMAEEGARPRICPPTVDPNVFESSTIIVFERHEFPIDHFRLRSMEPLPRYYRCLYSTVPERPLDTSRLYYWDDARVWAWSYTLSGIPYIQVESKLGTLRWAGDNTGGSTGGVGRQPEDHEIYEEWIGGVRFNCYNTSLDDGTRIQHCDAADS